MNIEIFKHPDPSGRMSKESFLIKNHPEEYDNIVNYCHKNKIFDIPFKEKVYLCLNSILKVPICKNQSCNKRVKFINSTIGYRDYCSTKCISSDPNIKQIKERKSLDKFGTKTPAEAKDIKDKIIKTNQIRYGGNSAMSSDEIREKSKQTLIKNWGVSNPSKSEDILQKRVQSFKNNVEQYKKSYKDTSNKKYGVDHPWMNLEIHNKSIESSKNIRSENLKEIIHGMLPKDYRFIGISSETKEVEIICDKNHKFSATRNSIYNRWRINSEICTICNPISKGVSGAEVSLCKFIEGLTDSTIIVNERQSIFPFEIDIYLPELKIGFEYNGLWWHSTEYREYDYHLLKKKKSLQNGIKIFTIWEDEWIFRQDAVKSYICNKLKKINNNIYARNCKIKELNRDDADKFNEINHLSGKTTSSVRISLEFNNEVIALVTFIRNGQGWNLNRFCIKNYTRVVGGFSKILKYFQNKYQPKFIITYSDNLQSDGEVYEKNGFEMIGELQPSYTVLLSKKRAHRLNNLNSNDLPKIYNAGNKKWILKFDSNC